MSAPMPQGRVLDVDKMKATFDTGALKVHVPKVEAA
jgi:HSP20 family molecular chaperone IbpA